MERIKESTVSYNINYFYEDFKNSQKRINILRLSKKEKNKIDFKLYRTIILKYLTLYVYDLLFLKRPLYFLLSGKVIINKCGNWIRESRNFYFEDTGELKKSNSSLGIYWYNRPFQRANIFKIKKRTGSTNLFPKIEEEWKRENDIDLLPSVKELRESGNYRLINSKFFEK